MDSRLSQHQTGATEPLIPGDPEREAEAICSKEGIPLLKPVVDDLLDISKRTGIPFETKGERLGPKAGRQLIAVQIMSTGVFLAVFFTAKTL